MKKILNNINRIEKKNQEKIILIRREQKQGHEKINYYKIIIS